MKTYVIFAGVRVAERSSRIRNIAQYYMQGRIGSDAGPSFW